MLRTETWALKRLGSFPSCNVFNTDLVPILEDFAQLQTIDTQGEVCMDVAIRGLALGSGSWRTRADAENLSGLGARTAFRTFAGIAMAAKLASRLK